jgi:ABC-type antimicrobial peptide transport system permease subunit
MKQNLIALIDEYNDVVAVPNNVTQISRKVVERGGGTIEMPCKVTHIGNDSYGKMPKNAKNDQIIMEFKHLYPLLSRYLPTRLNSNEDFKQFLLEQGADKIYELSDFMMMTLPSPRIDYYKSSNYFDIQKGVTGYANEIIEALGFFPVRMDLDVLKQMETFSQAILFLGLIFDIIILLFVILSVLLIYSLLMISVESKTFEFGVMRMV